MIIEENVSNKLEINKSQFITYLYKVKDKNEVIDYLNNLKKIHKNATHICYAYIIENEVKFNDDNEPNGTSGIPILEVLKKNNLNYIACFVVRYFGGIKLGANGLVKAYSNSANLCLKKTKIKELTKLYKITFNVTYKENNLIKNFLNNQKIIEKNYNDKINYTIIVNSNFLNKLNELNISYTIIEENYF